MSYDLVRISYLAQEIEYVAAQTRQAAKEGDTASLAAIAAQGRLATLGRRLDELLRPVGRKAQEPLTEGELYAAYRKTKEKE